MQDPHHVYLDLDVINNNHTPGGSPPYLRFEEIRNMPLLDGDIAEYFCSIVRFTIKKGNTLPMCSFPAYALGNTTQIRLYIQCH